MDFYGFFVVYGLRSNLIWVYTVGICRFVRPFGVKNFRTFTVKNLIVPMFWANSADDV